MQFSSGCTEEFLANELFGSSGEEMQASDNSFIIQNMTLEAQRQIKIAIYLPHVIGFLIANHTLN